MTRTKRRVNIPALVTAMIEAGAAFTFTSAGSLFVLNLASLPVTLADEFYECDAKALVTYLRQEAAQSTAHLRQIEQHSTIET